MLLFGDLALSGSSQDCPTDPHPRSFFLAASSDISQDQTSSSWNVALRVQEWRSRLGQLCGRQGCCSLYLRPRLPFSTNSASLQSLALRLAALAWWGLFCYNHHCRSHSQIQCSLYNGTGLISEGPRTWLNALQSPARNFSWFFEAGSPTFSFCSWPPKLYSQPYSTH
jgi:hypothetical protein